MRFIRFSATLALACLAAASPAAGAATPALVLTGEPVLPGEEVERELVPGEEHAYRIASGALLPVRLVVEQHGVDVEIEITTESEPVVADGPFDRRFHEAVLLESTDFVLRGREVGAPEGRYALRLEKVEDDVRLQAARAEAEAARLYPEGTADAWRRAIEHHRRSESAWRRAGDDAEAVRHLYARAVLHRLADEPREALAAAEDARAAYRRLADPASEAYAHNELGLDHWRLGDLREARAAFHRTASLAEVYDDRYLLGVASANLCLMHLSRGEILQGRKCYEGALPVIEEAGSPFSEGAARINLGRIAEQLGEPAEARAQYRRALEVQELAGDRLGQAQTLNNLGVLLRGSGDFDGAMESYAQASRIFEEAGRTRWQGRAVANMGYVYLVLEEPRRAIPLFERALRIFRRSGDARGEANTLDNLGLAEKASGNPRQARELHQAALELRRRSGHRRGEAVTLRRLGEVRAELGEEKAALEDLRRSVEIAKDLGDHTSEAEGRRSLGEALFRRGRLDEARHELERARDLAAEVGLVATRGETLVLLARLEEKAGRREAARSYVGRALRLLESSRSGLSSPDLRVSYSRLLHRALDVEIGLSMAAHRRDPTAGHAREALESAERSRARAFMELLQEAEVDLTRGVAVEILDRRSRIALRLAAKSRRLLEPTLDADLRRRLEADHLALRQRLEVVESQIRRLSPAYAEIVRPRPLEAEEMRSLLDSETILGVYFLGESVSVLWRVSKEGIEAFELPARESVEAAVHRLHAAWSRPRPARRAATHALAEELARDLRVDRLAGAKRLAVVADGALQLLPFAALPVPGRGGAASSRLGIETSVVRVPSVSFLGFRRDGREGGKEPSSLIVVADPLVGPGSRALPGSRLEAEAILEITGTERGHLAAGPDARLDLVERKLLAGHKVVHFATHGLIDTENPTLSGLVLSRSGPSEPGGRGFLGLRGIYELDLDADLVVLSGCRTALGPVVRGEGVIGLVRGFLHAGSRRVIGSLWEVEDRATAELMRAFYRFYWQEEMPASRALARAQSELAESRRHRDPYYWAGFFLVGDW